MRIYCIFLHTYSHQAIHSHLSPYKVEKSRDGIKLFHPLIYIILTIFFILSNLHSPCSNCNTLANLLFQIYQYNPCIYTYFPNAY